MLLNAHDVGTANFVELAKQGDAACLPGCDVGLDKSPLSAFSMPLTSSGTAYACLGHGMVKVSNMLPPEFIIKLMVPTDQLKDLLTSSLKCTDLLVTSAEQGDGGGVVGVTPVQPDGPIST